MLELHKGEMTSITGLLLPVPSNLLVQLTLKMHVHDSNLPVGSAYVGLYYGVEL